MIDFEIKEKLLLEYFQEYYYLYFKAKTVSNLLLTYLNREFVDVMSNLGEMCYLNINFNNKIIYFNPICLTAFEDKSKTIFIDYKSGINKIFQLIAEKGASTQLKNACADKFTKDINRRLVDIKQSMINEYFEMELTNNTMIVAKMINMVKGK